MALFSGNLRARHFAIRGIEADFGPEHAGTFRRDFVPHDPNDEPASKLLERLGTPAAFGGPPVRKRRAVSKIQQHT